MMSAAKSASERSSKEIAKPNEYYGLEEVRTHCHDYVDVDPPTADSRVSPDHKGLKNVQNTGQPAQEPVIYHVLEAPRHEPQAVQAKQDDNLLQKLHSNKFGLLTVAVVTLWMVVIVLAMVGFIQLYNQNTQSSSTHESTSSLQSSNENISVYIQAPLKELNFSLQQLNKSIAMNSEIGLNQSAYIKYHIPMMFDKVNKKIKMLDKISDDFLTFLGELDRSILRLATSILMQFGMSRSSPAFSCASILQLRPTSPSDYYWVLASNGSAVHVYCAMTAPCDTVVGGWARIAQVISNFSKDYELDQLLNCTLFQISQIIVKVKDDYYHHNNDWTYFETVGRRISCYSDTVPDARQADACFCFLIDEDVDDELLSNIIWNVLNFSNVEIYVR